MILLHTNLQIQWFLHNINGIPHLLSHSELPVPAGIEGLRTTTKGKNGEMSRLVGQQNIYIFITYIYNVRPA